MGSNLRFTMTNTVVLGRVDYSAFYMLMCTGTVLTLVNNENVFKIRSIK